MPARRCLSPLALAVLVVHLVLEDKRHLLQLLRHLLQQLRQPWVQQLRQQQPRLRLERTRG